MKSFCLVILLSITLSATAQVTSTNDYVGHYAAKLDSLSPIVIRKEGASYTIEFVGQGRVSMSLAGKDRFKVSRVRPKANVEFVRDEKGRTTKFKWLQPIPKMTFRRITPMDSDRSSTRPVNLLKYTGNFTINNRQFFHVRLRGDHLTAQNNTGSELVLKPVSGNQFALVEGDLKLVWDFVPESNGAIQSLVFSRTGDPEFLLTTETEATPDHVYGFNHPNGFTRADTLRGKLTPLRTCYDVLFYDLNVTVHPTTQSVSGSNTIRFKTIHTFDRMQIDLFGNMKIEKILFQNTPLTYSREFNAVFIQFPFAVKEGTVDEIKIVYSGRPQTPDLSILAGGILWLQDKEGQPWIETVTQGSGASLWWPCKDHLSDKPDSMKISVTVPRGLTDISNGRLLRKTEVEGNQTRFDWYVSYPITNYCVVMNIGNYAHSTDQYISGRDTLPIHYYYLPHDAAVAKKILKHTPAMLSLFEKNFGRYPFHRDGFTAMQSPYPMEHQSAVSIGSIFNPFNSETYDSLDMIRTLWHESAHEWWGNNVTVKDMADLWIHEAFASYAEVLAYEKLVGKAEMMKYIKEQIPGNREPIIGKYDVNDFRLGDMYSKGALMLLTLKNVIDNDSAWFDLLRSIQTHFAYQTITTDDLITFINQKTKTDYSSFFAQYLTKASIPVLQLRFKKEGKNTIVKYRWNADVEKFNMPVKVTTTQNVYSFIYPTREWKELSLTNMKAKEFNVATDQFYIAVERK
jgi:hypothetical protein